MLFVSQLPKDFFIKSVVLINCLGQCSSDTVIFQYEASRSFLSGKCTGMMVFIISSIFLLWFSLVRVSHYFISYFLCLFSAFVIASNLFGLFHCFKKIYLLFILRHVLLCCLLRVSLISVFISKIVFLPFPILEFYLPFF